MPPVVEAFIIIALLISSLCCGINIYSYFSTYALNTAINSGQFCDDGIPIKLAHHLDKDDGYFSSTVVNTGNENENDDSFNTYSQIGVITGSDRSIYLDQNDFYTFKLKYVTLETNSSQILIWKQTSWLTIGYTPISIPARTNDWRIPLSNFNGLARQHRVASTYLSSVHDVLKGAWFNAVCTTGCNDCVTEFYHPPTAAQNYSGGDFCIHLYPGDQPDGIICYDSLTCRSMEFYICQYPQTNNPTTSEPTTSEPTSTSPTAANPTTAAPTSTPPESSHTTELPTTASPTTNHPTTSQPTTPEPTSTSPTTSNPTTSAPTSAPSKASDSTESATTVSPYPRDLVAEEDVNMINDPNTADSEINVATTTSGGNREFIKSEVNSSSSSDHIVYYIIGGAAFCCVVSSVLMYYLGLTRKNRMTVKMMENDVNVSDMQTSIVTKPDTHIHSHSPRSDGIGSEIEPSNFVNDLGSLSSVNSIITPKESMHEQESTDIHLDTDMVFKGEQDIAMPPAVHRKLQSLQSLQSLASHQSDYEIEMEDIVMTANGYDNDDNVEVVGDEMDGDNDVVLETKGGDDIDGVERDEFVVEGDDNEDVMQGNEGNYGYDDNVTIR